MTVDLLKNSVLLSGAQEDISGEVTVSETIRLNDNMSSINKILFSGQSVLIKSTESYLGGVAVKGEVSCTIIYLGENGATDAITSTLPFEYLKDTALKNGGSVYARTKVVRTEILPMKQRRLDLNVTLAVDGFAADEVSFELLGAVDGVDGMNYLRDEREAVLARTKTAHKDVSYNFSCGRIVPGKILYFNAAVSEVTTNSSSSGVLVNAMIDQYVVYTSKNEEDETVTYHSAHDTYAVNQFVETEFGSEFNAYDVSPCFAIADARFVYNDSGEVDVELEGTMSTTLLLISQVPYTVVCDLFSTASQLDIKSQDIRIMQSMELRRDISTVAGSAKISADGFNKVAASSETVACDCRMEAGALSVSGTLVCEVILIKNANGEAETVTLTGDFAYDGSASQGQSVYAFPSVNSISYEVSGDDITFRADILNNLILVQNFSETQPIDAQVSDYDNAEDNFVTIKVRYINENENIWSLAKENRTSIAQILAANNLESEDAIKSSKPLIIRNF